MNHIVSPASISPPAANYAHAVLTESAARWLHTSGVVPTQADGTVPATIEEQATVVWANLQAILREAGMDASDVVSVTTYVVVDQLSSLGAVMAARDAALDGQRVASTLVTVPALARSEWKMEIALIAASPDVDTEGELHLRAQSLGLLTNAPSPPA
ncbi:MAG TPA: Rid family hydrolase [Ilumatobacteraceae bacterium]|nr:Rid family hydrolase [Ilumatobacteraceae bacterium]HRB01999.1 Rid family hydrolase [Ilumatobacteraceae bacterium]